MTVTIAWNWLNKLNSTFKTNTYNTGNSTGKQPGKLLTHHNTVSLICVVKSHKEKILLTKRYKSCKTYQT